jgi:hypothetical protein
LLATGNFLNLVPRKATSLSDIFKADNIKKEKKVISFSDLSGKNSLSIKINIVCQPGKGNKKYLGIGGETV